MKQEITKTLAGLTYQLELELIYLDDNSDFHDNLFPLYQSRRGTSSVYEYTDSYNLEAKLNNYVRSLIDADVWSISELTEENIKTFLKEYDEEPAEENLEYLKDIFWDILDDEYQQGELITQFFSETSFVQKSLAKADISISTKGYAVFDVRGYCQGDQLYVWVDMEALADCWGTTPNETELAQDLQNFCFTLQTSLSVRLTSFPETGEETELFSGHEHDFADDWNTYEPKPEEVAEPLAYFLETLVPNVFSLEEIKTALTRVGN